MLSYIHVSLLLCGNLHSALINGKYTKAFFNLWTNIIFATEVQKYYRSINCIKIYQTYNVMTCKYKLANIKICLKQQSCRDIIKTYHIKSSVKQCSCGNIYHKKIYHTCSITSDV